MDPRYFDDARSTRQTMPHTGSMPSAVDESPSRIRDYVVSGEQLLSELQNAVDMLEKRLDTALTPCPPAPASVDAVNKRIESHLTGRLGILTEGLSYTVQRLHGLRARVEV